MSASPSSSLTKQQSSPRRWEDVRITDGDGSTRNWSAMPERTLPSGLPAYQPQSFAPMVAVASSGVPQLMPLQDLSQLQLLPANGLSFQPPSTIIMQTQLQATALRPSPMPFGPPTMTSPPSSTLPHGNVTSTGATNIVYLQQFSLPSSYPRLARHWGLGLCDFCHHCDVCLMSLFLPCIAYTQISARAGAMTVLSAFIVSTLPYILAAIGSTLCISAAFPTSYNYYVDGSVLATTQVDTGRFVLTLVGLAVCVIISPLLSLSMWIILRGKVRTRLNIKGNCCSDCCCILWCGPCTVAQMGAEIGMYKEFSCCSLAPLPISSDASARNSTLRAKRRQETPTPQQIAARHKSRKRNFCLGSWLWTITAILLASGLGLLLGNLRDVPSLESFGSGPVVTTIAGSFGYSPSRGNKDGLTYRASFFEPSSVAVDSKGTIYVVDILFDSFYSFFDNVGHDNVPIDPSTARLNRGLTAEHSSTYGTSLAAPSWGVKEVLIRKVTAAGLVSTVPLTFDVAGSFYEDRITAPQSFMIGMKGGLFVDTDESIYIADAGNDRICRMFPNGTVIVIAGRYPVSSFNFDDDIDDGAEKLHEANFSEPRGLARDAAGYIYVADTGYHRIRKVSMVGKGSVRTIAGTCSPGANDGPGMLATFRYPTGVAVDQKGKIYVADSGNHKIRKIDSYGMVSTVAGQGEPAHRDGSLSVALFSYPEDLKVDGDGNIFVCESGDSGAIRVITTSGEVRTLAGMTGNTYDRQANSGDGPGARVALSRPSSIALTSSGAVIVADQGHYMIRQVTGNFGLPGWDQGGAVPPLDTDPSVYPPIAGLGTVQDDPAGCVSSSLCPSPPR